jgi:transcriptional regulator with XRE-family HTH domain
MTLGDNIRDARMEKGWSQRTLAEKIESDTSYINRIETGKLNPSVAALIRIADALERTLDQLVKNDGETEPEIHIRDKSLSERMRLVDSLDEDDRNALIHMIDTLTKQRMKELIVGKEAV